MRRVRSLVEGDRFIVACRFENSKFIEDLYRFM